MKRRYSLLGFCVCSLLIFAQKTEVIQKKLTVSGLLVGDYGISLSDNVDINGTHNNKTAVSTNGFYLRYARVQGKFDILKDLSVQVLVNLADFKGDTKTKVLEIATLKYHLNNYLNFQLGQFRPYFGLEDMYAADILKSYTWSNQYSLFGKNNWESFQQGAALFGSLKDLKIPLQYYYSVYNGNGKNPTADNDNSKFHSFRLDYKLLKGVSLGANAAFTTLNGEAANAYGVDLTIEEKMNDAWLAGIETEYKKGTNFDAYNSSTLVDKKLNNFKLQGIYTIPYIRWTFNSDKKFGFELSCRYEYLEDINQNGNPVKVTTPMLSFCLGDAYSAKISLVGQFTDYKTNIDNSTKYDNSQFMLQYQVRL